MAERGRRPATGARSTAHPRPVANRGKNERADKERGAKERVDKERGPQERGADLAALRTQLRSIVEPLAREGGFDLEDLAVTRVGRRHVVRITVDADGGIGHDQLSDLSRVISAGLDAAESGGDGQHGGELIAGSYTLEVSSPGVDRPLTLPRHWRRNVGRLVRASVDGATVAGRVTAADDAGVTFTVDGQARTVAHDRLGPGRVQLEFARPDGDENGDEDWELTGEEDGS
jgi:ribosome maturation factor RimP